MATGLSTLFHRRDHARDDVRGRRAAPDRPGFRFARVRGIDVRIDWSLAVVFWLIAFNLGAGLFPAHHPEWGAMLRWSLAIVAAVLFFLSILAHELAHALVGRARGVPVEDITLFIFGGVARMTGEPKSAGAEFLMTVVGPLTSFLIGIVCTLSGVALAGLGADSLDDPAALARRLSPVATVLLWLGSVNLFLGLFNLLPGFPLDGGRLLRAVIWRITGDLRKATRVASSAGRLLAMMLVFAGVMMLFGQRVPLLGGGAVQGFWLILIGWFLNNAAVQSYQQVLLSGLLADVPVSRLMRRQITAVDPEESVAEAVRRFLTESDQRCLAVVEGDRLAGLVCLSDVRKVDRERWPQTHVREIMTPAAELLIARPDEGTADAIRKLAARDVDQIPVLEDGRVAGMLRRADVVRWLELQDGAAR